MPLDRPQIGSKTHQFHPYPLRAEDDTPSPNREEIRRNALARSRENHRLRSEKDNWDPFCELAQDPFNMQRARGAGRQPADLTVERESPELRSPFREAGTGGAGTSAVGSAASTNLDLVDNGPQAEGEHKRGKTMKTQASAAVADRRDIESSKLKADIKAMRLRIQILERSEARLKQQVRQKAETIKDMKVGVEQARSNALKAEEKTDAMKAHLRELHHNLERYRGWWLTEYYSMKVILQLVPNKDVNDIAMSSQARFRTHSEHQ